jgi:hypothetical protein
MCRDGFSEQRLRELRRLYEPYAETLSRHFCMPLPPWIAEHPHKDNWLTVAKVRDQAEEANPSADMVPGGGRSQSMTVLEDDPIEI